MFISHTISERRTIAILSLMVMLACYMHAYAALPQPSFSDKNDGDVTISILTAYPGKIFYELEGHTMLRIKSSDYDVCVNWGVFDFNESDFIYRFVKGETDYIAAAFPTELSLYEYRMNGRRVVEQILDLDSIQKTCYCQRCKQISALKTASIDIIISMTIVRHVPCGL